MALSITILEVSGNVVVTASGSINLSGLTFAALTGGGSAFVNPSGAVIVSSAVGFDMDSYGGNSTISNLGSGGFTSASSYSGDDFGIAGAGNEIYVRQGYVSNTPINGTITFNGTNFTTMGFTQGTYTSSWASDSVTIQVGLPPSPTPTNTQTPTVTPTNTPTPTSTPQPNSIEITSVNYVGQIADITYTPCSGGTISLGSHVIPYTFQSFNYTGQYSLYFSAFNSTCSYEITCPTPTPTPTLTQTPTPTSGASGNFNVTISQVGLDVVWSGSGFFNLAALSSTGPGSVSSGFNAGQAIWAIGVSAATDTYSGTSLTYPTSFGTGGLGVTSSSGSTVGILPGPPGVPRVLHVPSGYISNTTISGGATYANNTIAGMGLSAGTYTWNFTTGGNSTTLVMNIVA